MRDLTKAELDTDDVTWEKSLRVRVLRQTPEVSGPRGWAEAAVEYWTVEKDGSGLLLTIGGDRFRMSDRVIEAIYDMHQDIPR